MSDADLFAELERVAIEEFGDGHVTILRFTHNWRVGFGTLDDNVRWVIEAMPEGKTFAEAARKAIELKFYLEAVDGEALRKKWEADADAEFEAKYGPMPPPDA